jgi:hypothetical protein
MLPLELIYNISQYINTDTMFNLRLTCKYISSIKFKINSYFTMNKYSRLVFDTQMIKIYSLKKIDLLSEYERDNITHLIIYNNDIKRIDYIEILKLINLKSLIFQGYFNQYIKTYPKNLEYLEFPHHFDCNIVNLPSNIKKIKFGCNFNSIFDRIPDSVQEIHFNINYRKNIEVIRTIFDERLSTFNSLTFRLYEDIKIYVGKYRVKYYGKKIYFCGRVYSAFDRAQPKRLKYY